MGVFSCNSKSAIAICDSHSWDLKKKKKRNRNKNPSSSSPSSTASTASTASTSSNSKTHKEKTLKIKQFTYSDLESSTGGFSSQSFLGKGSHGSVHKAVLEDGHLTVAVKRTPPSSSLQEPSTNTNNNVATPMDNEIEILSQIRNRRLVNLLGFSLDSHMNKLLVVEFMPNGSLYDLLHSTTHQPPGWPKRIRHALQVAKAIETLHTSNPPVIHRDIKSSNVLIDENWNARLGDFGLALRGHVEDVKIKRTPPAGTLGYLDPGYVSPENLSAKSDVFSFGILLLEMISGRNAIDVNYSPPSVIDWALPLIKRGEFIEISDTRIGFPENPSLIEEIAVLASWCVRSTAEKRPTMTEVVNCLKFVDEIVSSPIWNNFRRRMRKQSSSSFSSSQELLGTSKELVKSLKHGILRNSSLKNRKVSSFEPQFDHGEEVEQNLQEAEPAMNETQVVDQLPLVQMKPGLGIEVQVVKMQIRLNRSKSMGVLQSPRLLVHDSGRRFVLQLVKNPQIRVFDLSRLVLRVEKCTEKNMNESEKQSTTKLISC